jgi:hypothetical protein
MYSVLDLHKCRVESATAYVRDPRTTRLKQFPIFTLQEADTVHLFASKIIMWKFLDSIFPKKILPRGPVEDDFFAPSEHIPSMREIMQGFLEEAQEDVRYLVLQYKDGDIVNVFGLDEYVLSRDVEAYSVVFDKNGYGSHQEPFVFRDKNGAHIRPSLVCEVGVYLIRITDLGKRLYCTITGVDDRGHKFIPIKPESISKNERAKVTKHINEMVAETMYRHDRSGKHMGRAIIVPHSSRTVEVDTLLYERFGRQI